VLQESEISSQWSKALRSFLVADVDIPGGGKGLWIWAGSGEAGEDGPDGAARPDDPADPRHWLASEDAQRFAAFVGGMGAKGSGATVMTYRGEECFWAYATPLDGLRFVLILPASVVAPYADEARRDVSDAAGGSFDHGRDGLGAGASGGRPGGAFGLQSGHQAPGHDGCGLAAGGRRGF
jgi:hypothetical protein